MTTGWRVLILTNTALAIVALLTNVVLTLDRDRVAVDRLVAAERGVCERLQSVRDGVNRHGAIIYVVLRRAAQTAAEAGDDRRAENWRIAAGLPMYRPPTNCRAAVDHPLTYRPPQPIPFRLVPSTDLEKIIGAPLAP